MLTLSVFNTFTDTAT